jgi:hypothetical protein
MYSFRDYSFLIEGERIMSKSNKALVPEAKEALNQFKMEAATEVGVNLKQGYNGDLTSKQAGSVGGQMVKDIGNIAVDIVCVVYNDVGFCS